MSPKAPLPPLRLVTTTPDPVLADARATYNKALEKHRTTLEEKGRLALLRARLALDVTRQARGVTP